MNNREILLELRRLYSKDETVKMLSDELASADIRNGFLKSEISELKDRLNALTTNPPNTKEAKAQIHDLRTEKNMWRARYYELLGKQYIEQPTPRV